MFKEDVFSTAKIFIVDDELTSVRLLTKILSDAGYTNIKSTRDPKKVEKLYSDFEPDLLILDLHMPHMEGFKIMDQLKAIHKDDDYLPILVISQERNRVIQRKQADLLYLMQKLKVLYYEQGAITRPKKSINSII